MVSRNEIATEISEEEFQEVMHNSHRLVVVDFFAEWCMPCLMLSPIIEELAKKFGDVKFVTLNVDDNEKISTQYRVSSIPCLVFFKEGKEVDRIIGLRDSENIEEKIMKNLM